jgi:excisionase family DNA binding protein
MCRHTLLYMQTATPPAPHLLTVRQVQELLHIDRSTIYRMASDGRLPSIRVGKQLRFPSQDIAALVSGTTAATGPDISESEAPLPTPDPIAAAAAIGVAAQLLDVMMVVTDMSGHPITAIVNACPGFEALTQDETTLESCLSEWRALAEDTDLSPRFAPGRLGFECARAFIRNGTTLIGMVLVGGIAPAGASGWDDTTHPDGLIHLDAARRAHVLESLPMIARAIADAPNSPTPTSPEPGA